MDHASHYICNIYDVIMCIWKGTRNYGGAEEVRDNFAVTSTDVLQCAAYSSAIGVYMFQTILLALIWQVRALCMSALIACCMSGIIA